MAQHLDPDTQAPLPKVPVVLARSRTTTGSLQAADGWITGAPVLQAHPLNDRRRQVRYPAIPRLARPAAHDAGAHTANPLEEVRRHVRNERGAMSTAAAATSTAWRNRGVAYQACRSAPSSAIHRQRQRQQGRHSRRPGARLSACRRQRADATAILPGAPGDPGRCNKRMRITPKGRIGGHRANPRRGQARRRKEQLRPRLIDDDRLTLPKSANWCATRAALGQAETGGAW